MNCFPGLTSPKLSVMFIRFITISALSANEVRVLFKVYTLKTFLSALPEGQECGSLKVLNKLIFIRSKLCHL